MTILMMSFATYDDMKYLKQNDKDVRDLRFTGWDGSEYTGTISDSGCGLVCCVNLFKILTNYELDITEVIALYNSLHPKQKEYGMSTSFIKEFCAAYDFKCIKIQDVNKNTIQKYFDDDYIFCCLFSSGFFTSEKHYVLITGYDKEKFYIENPSGRGISYKNKYIKHDDVNKIISAYAIKIK